jgi:hypothetical protein
VTGPVDIPLLRKAVEWAEAFGLGLFDQDNTIEDVRRIAEGIAAEAGERL